jgi:predicted  nucleic acid-binding Zn-ribbon protein
MAKTAAQYEAEIKKLNDRLVDIEKQMKSAFDPATIATFAKAYEKLASLIEKTEQAQLNALNKESDIYDDITESLSDQLSKQVKIINKLKDQSVLTSKVNEIHEKLNDIHKYEY